MILWLSALVLVACDDHKFTGGSHSSDVDLDNGSSYDVVVEIMNASCTGCHNSASPAGNLNLEGNLCDATVGIASPTYGELLVTAGDHEASVLWH